MDVEKSLLETPRSFFVQEMRTSYQSWRLAFGRELLQNSQDAGAKDVHVTLSTEKAFGAFGDATSTDEVIRYVVQDDGCGMTAEVLDSVYFRLGESSKRSNKDSIGGFGRARLLVFAQDRYSVITGDRAVEGSGSEYVHLSLSEMADYLEGKAASIIADDVTSPEAAHRLSEIGRRVAELRLHASRGGLKGCKIEVDIDTNMYGPGSWNNPTIDEMMRELTGYLKTSQFGCRVHVNGEEHRERLLRGPARRTLTAELADGSVVPFATVHTNKSKSASFAKTLFVRVGGATMFKTGIEADLQVIVEVENSVARQVLTSNRDGFQSPYSEAFDKLKSELISDVRSALDNRENVHHTHSGGLGKMFARRPVEELTEMTDATAERPSPLHPSEVPVARESKAKSKLETEGFGGVPFPVWKWLFSNIDTYQKSILDGFDLREMRDRVGNAVAGRYGVDRVRTGLDTLSAEEMKLVVGFLRNRIEVADKQARVEAAARLAGLPDVHVHIKGEVPPAIRKAITRNDPRKWDPATGQGKAARGILAAWTICCESAIRTMLKHHPEAAPESFSWAPGFIYNAPKQEYMLGTTRDAFMIEAEFLHRKESGERFLLLNPIDSDGHLKYSPGERADLQKLAVLAAHEVAHISTIAHNEDFSSLMTDLMCHIDLQDIRQQTNSALRDIRDLYAKGRVRVQPMDSDEGIRPAARLAAHLAPMAFGVAGVLDAGGNSVGTDLLTDTASYHDDGTYEMDLTGAFALDDSLQETFSPEPVPEMSRYGR